MARKATIGTLGDKVDLVHVCTYAAPFGVIPTELDEVYPLSQNLIAYPFDSETVMYVANQTANYIKKTEYEKIILLRDPNIWKGKIMTACKRASKKKQVPFIALQEKDPWTKNTMNHLVTVIQESIMP